MHDHAEIDTERMILRPLALEHAQPLHSIYADTEAMRYWHEPPHEDLGATRAMLRALVSGSERAWVLCLREGGDAIGLGYYLGNAGAPGMGYILDPRHWRRGLIWEVVPLGMPGSGGRWITPANSARVRHRHAGQQRQWRE